MKYFLWPVAPISNSNQDFIMGYISLVREQDERALDQFLGDDSFAKI